VLETRQGAGTFVAEKAGVPEDPLGLTFISEGGDIKLALELSGTLDVFLEDRSGLDFSCLRDVRISLTLS